MKHSYEALKILYSHESAIHLDGQVTGTVYTPDWIAKQMVYLLIKKHLYSNHNAFDLEGVNFDALYLDAYIKGKSPIILEADLLVKQLLPLTILDLSCGSGVLLMAYLEFIAYLLKNTNSHSSESFCNLVQNQVVGLDIDPKAIHAFKLLLTEFSHSRGIYPTRLRIYCGNSLTEDLIDPSERFDLIIGNPPYIGEKNNLDYFKPVKQTPFGAKYYEGKMDYFYFFIYKGWSYLEETGSMCYLSSNYFLTADGAKKLRQFIKDKVSLSAFIDYKALKVFPEKNLHACVYVLQNKIQSEVDVYDASMILKKKLNKARVFQTDGTIQFILSDEAQRIVTAMSSQKMGTLGACYDIHQGIVSGSDKQFVYHEDALQTLPEPLRQYLVPFYKNSDIHHYYATIETPLHLLYIDQADVHEEVRSWLSPYKEKLMRRREVANQIREWYMLTWPRKKSIFTNEKIVAPQRAKSNRFAYVKEDFHASADVYYISAKPDSPYSLPVLTLILNSTLIFHWLSHMGKKKGTLLELYATPLKNIPIPRLDLESLRRITAYSDALYSGLDRLNDAQLESIKYEVDQILNKLL